jgi:hypothetical protein
MVGIILDVMNIQSVASNDLSLGKLMYSPSDTSSSESITNELATLLTSGRLSNANRQLIE